MKEIPGYPNYYVTKDGEVYTKRINPPKKLSKRLHHGYYHVNVKTGKGRLTKKKEPVHKLVLLAYKGDKPTQIHQCRHLNGNKLDNRISNLEWGTPTENTQDQIDHGTLAALRHGENSNASKLSKEQVLEIKTKTEEGLKQTAIAKEYGINQKHVSDIKLERTWKRLW